MWSVRRASLPLPVLGPIQYLRLSNAACCCCFIMIPAHVADRCAVDATGEVMDNNCYMPLCGPERLNAKPEGHMER